MKKTFTVTTIIQAAYIVLMAAAILLIALHVEESRTGFELGSLLFSLAIVLPIMPVCLAVNTAVFFARRKATEQKPRRVCLTLLILSPILVTVAWLACGVWVVNLTGGV